MLDELAIARSDGRLPRLLATWARTDVLLIDDFLLRPLSPDQAADILEVVEDRSGLRSTVLTSQLPVAMWHDAIGEPTLADAVLDRLLENLQRVELQGDSMRKTSSGRPAPRRPGSPSSVLPRTPDRQEGGELRGLDRPQAGRYTATLPGCTETLDWVYGLAGIVIKGAHEKGGVEGEIGRFRRRFMVPVPKVSSMAELNEVLMAAVEKDDLRHIAGRRASVAEHFALEAEQLAPLPAEDFAYQALDSFRVDRKARVHVRGAWTRCRPVMSAGAWTCGWGPRP